MINNDIFFFEMQMATLRGGLICGHRILVFNAKTHTFRVVEPNSTQSKRERMLNIIYIYDDGLKRPSQSILTFVGNSLTVATDNQNYDS